MERRHIVWNSENINRLQDYLASKASYETNYFGYQVGDMIVELCNYFVDDLNACKVLDYGCGKGHIMQHFCEKGINIWGIDMAINAMEASFERCKKYKCFQEVKIFDGGRLPFDSNSFDLVVCTECIEHVLPEHMDGLLDEILRVVKPEGRVLITTRNEEDFEKSELCCPECNTIYHRVGHVNRYSVNSLTELMEKHNYKTIMCNGTDFHEFRKYITHPPILDMSLKSMYYQFRRSIIKLTDLHRGTLQSKVFKVNMNLRYRPNLFYVGTK